MIVFAFLAQLSFGQQKTVTGVVKDETGLLPGVTVTNKSDRKSSATDFDGKYAIKANEGDILTFSFVGYSTKSIAVSQSNKIDVVLVNDTKIIEEVVVVGYGTQKRKEVTSSISKINGNDIRGLITPSFEGQLAGRASGVQITTQNGILGLAPRVRIRGVATISSGTQPLYVVDGLPIYSGDIGGQADTNGLADINPNDIESFEVLKDGAATAIYGSRAANGVVLVTTKKGKKGTMKISYNNVTGFASAVKRFDLLQTADFLAINNEKRANAGQAAWAAGSNFDTDWQSEVLNKGAFQTDHSLSMNGGTEKTKYFMSLGYSTQDGIAKSNNLNRYSVRANLEHELYSWLTIGANIGVTKTNTFGLNTGRNSISGNIFSAIRQLPNTSPFDATNVTGYNINASGNVGQGTNLSQATDNLSNISYVLANNKYESKVTRILSTAFFSANLFKGLNYRFQVGIDNASTNGFLYWNPLHGDGRGTNGRLTNDNTTRNRWNVQNVLSYNRTFAKDHNISLTAVYEVQKERNETFFAVGTNITDPFFNQNVVTGAYGTQESGGGANEEGIISYIGRANYNYKQRYFIAGTLRRDGLSKFNTDVRYQTFPGVSAGWNIARENFMEEFRNIVSEFKIRGSYSLTGNTNVGRSNYPYLSTYSPSFYGPNNGLAFTTFADKNLLWETSTKIDYGIDLNLFKDKLSLNFDYFKNTSEDVVLQFPVATSLGIPGNAVDKNAANVQNEGYEFGLNYSVFNTKNFKWDVSANLTLQKNKVFNLPNGADIFNAGTTDVNIQPNIIVREGESINALYGFTYYGVNPANGNPVYYKADGSLVQGNIPTGNYRVFNPNNPSDVSVASSLLQSDKKIQGPTLPTYFGGLSSRMSYKSFDFGFLIRFSGGNKIFNATRRELLNLGLSNNGTEILGRWQSAANPGDGWTPRIVANQNPFINQSSNLTTRFVEDGDFISLDNLSLGYSLPKLLLQKINVDGIRIFVQGQNLIMLTKYTGLDPELETLGIDFNGTPRSRIYSIGINVNL